MKKVRQTMKEMFAGLAVWLFLVLVILMVIASHRLAMAMGLLLGGSTAAGLLLHMCHHLDIALDMDVKHAQSHVQFAAMRRLFFMAVVLAVSMAGYKYFHPLGTVLGLSGMKISAYLYPVIHKVSKNLRQ